MGSTSRLLPGVARLDHLGTSSLTSSPNLARKKAETVIVTKRTVVKKVKAKTKRVPTISVSISSLTSNTSIKSSVKSSVAQQVQITTFNFSFTKYSSYFVWPREAGLAIFTSFFQGQDKNGNPNTNSNQEGEKTGSKRWSKYNRMRKACKALATNTAAGGSTAKLVPVSTATVTVTRAGLTVNTPSSSESPAKGKKKKKKKKLPATYSVPNLSGLSLK